MVNENIEMDANYVYVGKLTNVGDGLVKSTNGSLNVNDRTYGGHYNADDVWQRLAMEAVAINGKGRGGEGAGVPERHPL